MKAFRGCGCEANRVIRSLHGEPFQHDRNEVCVECEEKRLACNQQVICIGIGIAQGDSCGNEWQDILYHCLLINRSWVLKNQIVVSRTAIMSDSVTIGDYELLEKKNEGY